MTHVHPLALLQGPDGEHPAAGPGKPDNSTAAAPTRRESNLCRQMYFLHAAKAAQALWWCDACPYLWLWKPWDAPRAMTAPERAATAGVGAPRPPTSVPEQGAVSLRSLGRASQLPVPGFGPHTAERRARRALAQRLRRNRLLAGRAARETNRFLNGARGP